MNLYTCRLGLGALLEDDTGLLNITRLRHALSGEKMYTVTSKAYLSANDGCSKDLMQRIYIPPTNFNLLYFCLSPLAPYIYLFFS
jgi:hypothetical protein